MAVIRCRKKEPSGPFQGEIEAAYDYRDEEGQLLFQVVRFKGKEFRQRHPKKDGGWKWNLRDVRRVPFRLPELLSGPDPVIITEGETDALTAAGLGFTATTNPGGAGKWRDSYSEFLKGRECLIIPGWDAPGEKHARKVAESLLRHGAMVKILALPEVAK